MIRNLLYVCYDVSGEQNNAFFSKIRNQIPEFHTLFRVKANCWFIQHNKGWIVQQCLCDTQTLFHAPQKGC